MPLSPADFDIFIDYAELLEADVEKTRIRCWISDKAKGCDKNTTNKGAVNQDPTNVPEPGIAVLVGSGLLALGAYVAVRRKQSN